MKQIDCSTAALPNKFALVDDEDFEWLNQWKWRAHKKRNTFYAVRSSTENGGTTSIRMHRLIMGFPSKLIDHANRNGLDNQRSNLRLCTNAQNTQNAVMPSGGSVFRGVTFRVREARYYATISVEMKKIHIGSFRSAVEAATAYNEAAKRLHGEFAILNEIPVQTQISDSPETDAEVLRVQSEMPHGRPSWASFDAMAEHAKSLERRLRSSQARKEPT